MPKYNVKEVVSDTKRSEFIYSDKNGKQVVLAPTGRGAPKSKFEHETHGLLTLVQIIKYAPAAAPRVKKEKVVKADKVEVKRVEIKGDTKRTELVYADGTVVIPTGGRPKLTNENGSPLVEIRTVTPKKVKGAKGRAKVPTVTEEVTDNAGIFYVYGGKEVARTTILAGRGAPPKTYNGKTLEKIIRRVLTATAKEEKKEEVIEEVKPTMAELGWEVGQNVRLKGSDKVAQVEVVRDEYIGIRYPGNKFIDTFNVKRLERVA